MNKELEKVKKWIQERIVYIAENCDLNDSDNKRAYDNLKTALNYIENSISKEELKNDLKILQETKVDDKEKFWMKSGIEEYLKKLLEGK